MSSFVPYGNIVYVGIMLSSFVPYGNIVYVGIMLCPHLFLMEILFM